MPLKTEGSRTQTSGVLHRRHTNRREQGDLNTAEADLLPGWPLAAQDAWTSLARQKRLWIELRVKGSCAFLRVKDSIA
jgi:hypothetical protein